MVDCNPLSTKMEKNLKITSKEGNEFRDSTKYRQLVGSLIYLNTIRLDISFSIGILSRFMKNPCEGHYFDAKRVLMYLNGTQDFCLKYSNTKDFKLVRYTNSDNDRDT
jgi:hypothetical protein